MQDSDESGDEANQAIMAQPHSPGSGHPHAAAHGKQLHHEHEPAALVCVNVLMIQDILDDPDCPVELTAEDERGLTPLFWSHVLPYGEVKLNMHSRLAFGG
ncbi:hypothetical protein [Nocardia sp. NPDC046763]|uniref:hypothetical protein n=1 Tax=Nocardia sp. NPDC046763 TaxID=3155256 RepID=UPI0034027DE9